MPDLDLVLSPTEQRILGSLLEKQVTVPASYPLTLSGLRSACNQTSSREPVTDLDEQISALVALRETIARLRQGAESVDPESCSADDVCRYL